MRQVPMIEEKVRSAVLRWRKEEAQTNRNKTRLEPRERKKTRGLLTRKRKKGKRKEKSEGKRSALTIKYGKWLGLEK